MKSIKQSAFVVRELVSREIKRKYSRSHLGILWSVLNPLLYMAVLSLIFSAVFRKSIENYPVYYLTGFLLWNFFTLATNGAMTSLVDNKTLLLQMKLPRLIFPTARVLSALVNFCYSLAAYLVILLVFRIPIRVSAAAFPVIVVLTVLFSLGIGFGLSILYSFFGDIRYLYGVLLTLWMYLSALFYPVEILPEGVKSLIRWNPMYSYISGARDCILYGRMPDGGTWISMILWGVGIFALGWWIFRKGQTKIVEKL